MKSTEKYVEIMEKLSGITVGAEVTFQKNTYEVSAIDTEGVDAEVTLTAEGQEDITIAHKELVESEEYVVEKKACKEMDGEDDDKDDDKKDDDDKEKVEETKDMDYYDKDGKKIEDMKDGMDYYDKDGNKKKYVKEGDDEEYDKDDEEDKEEDKDKKED